MKYRNERGDSMTRAKTLIMGAAGRDFHNFNTYFRRNDNYDVVAFTATQIPDIEGRRYPPELSGDLYPDGVPIHPEERLEELIRSHGVQLVVFAYSDVSHEYVMHMASRVTAQGPDFILMGPNTTTLKSKKPVVAVTAVRTGVGKSQTTRRVAEILQGLGKKVVAVRHPMPYGDLSKQIWQRFGSLDDLDRYDCTIEEREEYEPHINRGITVYAGVDYQEILSRAEAEADVILWDGGNNDLPFFKPSIHITLVDPHRAGHEVSYYPGETNLRMADVLVINKIATAPPQGTDEVRENIAHANPEAIVIDAASPITVDKPQEIRGKRALVIEDGPTLTHGNMKYGAGVVAAKKFGASALVDPREAAVGRIAETFRIYPEIGTLLPAMGYSEQQIEDLETTINKTECDVVVIATPIDLRRLIDITHPMVRVGYDLQEIGAPTLESVLKEKL